MAHGLHSDLLAAINMGIPHSSAVTLLAFSISLAKMIGLAVTAFVANLALGLRLQRTMVVPADSKAPPEPEFCKVRLAREDEIIAEFLKNEFHYSDFDEVRKEFAALVLTPNFASQEENTRRRHLLFRKRGGLWRELPPDTTWWEVSISPRALGRIRVFPRADWRRYAQRGFSLPQFAGRISAGLAQTPPDPFLSSLQVLQQQLAKGGSGGSVLLIGIDEEKPLTILEGNHRMVAAALKPSPQLGNFRFYCGFSPHMAHCCWYQSSVASLLHYAGNLLRHMSQFRHSDVARFIPKRRLAARAALGATGEPLMQLSGTGLQMTDTQLKGSKDDVAA